MKRQGIRCFGIEEVRKLLNYLKDRKSLEREYFIVDLTLNTGLRIAEVYSLNVGDVYDRKRLKVIGKGDKLRSIPLNAEIRRHIEKYLSWKKKRGESLDLYAPLFVSRNKNRMSIRAIQRAFDKVLKDAGIDEDFTFHTLRHTFASVMYRTVRNIRTVQELLGHSRLDTTMVYTHVSEEDKEEAVDILSTTLKG